MDNNINNNVGNNLDNQNDYMPQGQYQQPNQSQVPEYQQYNQQYNQQNNQQYNQQYNQQNNYTQNGYMNEYQQIVPPQKQVPVEFIEWQMAQEEKHKASILCVISLLCHFVVPFLLLFIMGGISNIFGSGDISSTEEPLESFSTSVLSLLYGASYIASWVLMIIARVKYKHSVFAKVLMWLYIGLLILAVVGVIILIATCINYMRQCPG